MVIERLSSPGQPPYLAIGPTDALFNLEFSFLLDGLFHGTLNSESIVGMYGP